ncbi:MAG TPA: glycosyltransferase family 4 protein [Gaiellaceae bacterium]|jgi:glycosyltransferase involved in cell wall biosynthesis
MRLSAFAPAPLRALARRGRTETDWLRSRGGRADLAVFHEFAPPPYGGGNQFLLALVRELRSRGLDVEVNRLSGATAACLFNSFNFDFSRLQRFARDGVRMVHRVDGPVGVYRGFDDGTDRRVADINHALADATILQSRYSLEKHQEMDFDLREPKVISNTVDPDIFHPPAAREPLSGRRVRVIASSWSDNPRKGAEILAWLDRNLDFDTFELTFAGRTQQSFERIRAVGPLRSEPLADLLRTQDLYLAPSRDDPCSNALLEALACGLPAVYLRSGGHPEVVGEGGLAFVEAEEVPDVLSRLVEEHEQRRAGIRVPALSDVADRYLEVLAG